MQDLLHHHNNGGVSGPTVIGGGLVNFIELGRPEYTVCAECSPPYQKQRQNEQRIQVKPPPRLRTYTTVTQEALVRVKINHQRV